MTLCTAATVTWIGMLPSAAAQDAGLAPVIGNAMLPRDLSPWGMFMNADAVVKAVMIGLAFASLVTWTVWLAKTIELVARQAPRAAASNVLASVRSSRKACERLAQRQGRRSRCSCKRPSRS